MKQGFYPCGLTPYGFCKVPVEVRAGKKHRYKLSVEPREAEVLRTLYRLYVTGSGAMKVAEALNARGFRTRKGNLWDKGAVIQTLEQSAAGGVVRWGVHHRGMLQPPDKWIMALLTDYAGPLVCTSGWPSMDTQRLLDIARAQGIELYCAGDYDSVGLAIAGFMSTRYAAHVVMTKAVYLAADLERAPDWGDAGTPPTPWDVELADVIRTRRRIVYQEDPEVWRGLLSKQTNDDN